MIDRTSKYVVQDDLVYTCWRLSNPTGFSKAVNNNRELYVYTVHGKQFEGYLKTFSKTFELVISMTHQVDPERPQHIDPSTVVDMKIFKLDDIVRIEAKNVDLEYAIRDTFATDTAISKFNGVIGEKELEPWTEDSMLVGGPGGDNDFDLDQMCNHNNTGTAT
ncbi:hypothetical protein WDU94_015645, partial [Cyamophila willieti]